MQELNLTNMNNREVLKGPAYHEAGHILAIYLTCESLDSIYSSKIDSISEDHPSDYQYGGFTNLDNEPSEILASIIVNPSFIEFGIDFVMACYYYGGGVAEKLMTKQATYNDSSMEYDMKCFRRRCEERNIKDIERLSKLALAFCEQNFENMYPYLEEIADKLIEASYKNEWGLYGRELSFILGNVYENINTQN